VAAWYRRAGYEVVAQNWRCDQGEIDIVALGPAGDVVVFCEVKTRTSDRFGTPFEAVTTSKQRRVRRLATRWLAQGRAAGRPAYARVRFDVAAVTVHAGALDVEVLEDAF
jgi:putative endonuclease